MPVMSFGPNAMAVTILGVETSIAVVIPPPPEEVILRAVGKTLSASTLSINTNWVGSEVPVPLALLKAIYPVESSAVVTVKLESTAVLAKVKAISLEVVVVMVFPPS